MNRETLFQAIGGVEEGLIDETEYIVRKKAPGRGWKIGLTAAACLAIGAAGCYALLAHWDGGQGVSEGGISAVLVAAHSEGPVLPLTLAAENHGITAQRHIAFDVPEEEPGETGQELLEENGVGVFTEHSGKGRGSVLVTDSYTLTNTTGEEQRVTVLYPFFSRYMDLPGETPTLTVEGELATARILASDQVSGGENWEEYRDLLSDGHWLETALEAQPTWEEPVVVYEITGITLPQEWAEADVAWFGICPQTGGGDVQVLRYDFQGINYLNLSQEEGENWYQLQIFDQMKPVLIVRGGDLSGYQLRGYVREGEEIIPIEGVTATVTRRETTMEAILRELISYQCGEQGVDQTTAGLISHQVTVDLIFRGVEEILSQYAGTLEETFYDGRLESVIRGACERERICWLAQEVTIPAGECVTVSASMYKAASYDLEDGSGLDTYHLLTTAGSCLDFTGQTATLQGSSVKTGDQNLGFDLENGLETVTLDLAEDHYYVELQG